MDHALLHVAGSLSDLRRISKSPFRGARRKDLGPDSRLPLDPSNAQQVVDAAINAAVELAHDWVGTDGICCWASSTGAIVAAAMSWPTTVWKTKT